MAKKEDVVGLEGIAAEPKSERDLILEEIKSLENEKASLISKVNKLNEKRRLKTIEVKAMEPYLNEKKDVRAGPLLKKLKRLEFRLSQTINPKSEKNIIKQIQKLDKELKDILKIERMRKRKKLLEKDIKKLDEEIEKINQKLKEIREELKEKRTLFKSLKKKRQKITVSKKLRPEEDYIPLEHIVEIEKK